MAKIFTRQEFTRQEDSWPALSGCGVGLTFLSHDGRIDASVMVIFLIDKAIGLDRLNDASTIGDTSK
jgi:hypothetical protein